MPVGCVIDQQNYILQEVLKNACAATIKGGSTTPIEVRLKEARKCRMLERGEEVLTDCFDVEIVDRAGGIAKTDRHHVWTFGWSGHESPNRLGGYGVGLPLVEVYVTMFGGEVTLGTVEGYGTTVHIRQRLRQVEVPLPLPLDA
jgi:signal transduction histidine kinase